MGEDVRRNGPRRGSGRAAGPRELRRSEHLRITFREQEILDLKEISEAWNMPTATVAWAMIHTELQKCRKRAPDLGEAGLAIAAASRILGRHADPAESPSG